MTEHEERIVKEAARLINNAAAMADITKTEQTKTELYAISNMLLKLFK